MPTIRYGLLFDRADGPITTEEEKTEVYLNRPSSIEKVGNMSTGLQGINCERLAMFFPQQWIFSQAVQQDLMLADILGIQI